MHRTLDFRNQIREATAAPNSSKISTLFLGRHSFDMAGNKSPRVPKVKDDKTKKRKRDIHESGSQTKRPRSEQKGQGKNGHDRPAKDSRNGELSVAKSSSATGVQDERETEIARHFDAGEAGWKLSKPMGGRMLDIDPILTSDEQYVPSITHIVSPV